MLTIIVGADDVFDDESQQFRIEGGVELQLEHSLVSLSKWEMKYEKPFLGAETRTSEEALYYIECMVIGEKPPGKVLQELSEDNLRDINEYMNSKKSATWFADQPGEPQREVLTSELIYYWMTSYRIDWEAQYWHLNRLFTLIRIANVKHTKPKKMGPSEIAKRNRELNARRKEQLGTKG